MSIAGSAVTGVACLAAVAMFLAAEAGRDRRRSPADRLHRGRWVLGEPLEDVPAVRIAERIVHAAWLKSGQHRP